MTTITDLINEFRVQIRDVVPTIWVPETIYVSGQRVVSGQNVYLCAIGGTSGANAPTGQSAGVQDGTVYWNYLGTPNAPALSDLEVTQFITDGLRTYSRYRPRKESVTLAIIQGQSSYDLPVDWIDREFDSWKLAIDPPPVIDPDRLMPFTFIATTQLIARPMAYATDVSYDFYSSDLKLVITPPPQASYNLTFDYFAYHTASSSGCTVPYVDLDNALLPGLVKGLRSIAVDFSVKLQMYKAGNNITVDDRTVATNLQKRADELENQFLRDIIRRPIAAMG